MVKDVYNPKEHAENDKNVGSKKPKPVRADEPMHAEEGVTQTKPAKVKAKKKEAKSEEPVTEFPCKLNKYGFISIRKKARPWLPFQAEEPLTARIEKDALVITKAS